MEQATQRLFIALNLPAELRAALHDATALLREAAPGRWTSADNLHVTLKFLGERPEEEIRAIADALHTIGASARPVRLTFGGVGGFPNLRRARVVWMGVEPDPKLELLQHDVETAGAALGYELAGRPFRPHVTLGRLRDPDRAQLGALTRAAKRVAFSTATEVTTLDLMRSEMGPDGSRYSLLAAAPLGGT